MALPAATAVVELLGLAVPAAADLQAEELWRPLVVVEVVVAEEHWEAEAVAPAVELLSLAMETQAEEHSGRRAAPVPAAAVELSQPANVRPRCRHSIP